MKLHTEIHNEVTIVKLVGSLDVSVQKELDDAFGRIADGKDIDLVLDFTEVSFIDSSCLGLLASLLKSVRKSGGDLKLACMNEDVLSIFQITRLNTVFDIQDSTDEAVSAYYK